MKKIYSFIALMLMCFTGTLNAQNNWEPAQQVTADEIQEDVDYAIAAGDNTLESGEPGRFAGNTGHYLIAGQGALSENLLDECIFRFVKTNDEKEGCPVYVLKNVANGMYLSGNNTYAKTTAEAYRFTVRNAEAFDEPGGDGSIPTDDEANWPWEKYSKAVSSSRSINAVDNQSVVFCLVDGPNFLNFVGNPGVGRWIDTNNWMIFEVKGTEMNSYQKFAKLYDETFAILPVDEDHMPIGIDPGCVSEQFYNRMEVLSGRADALLGQGDKKENYAECDALREEIVAAFTEYQKLVTITSGYFVIENVRGGFINDNKKGYADKNLTWPVESWNIENAKYIWKVEPAEEEGRLLFQNFATKNYLDKNYNMVEKPNGSYTAPHKMGAIYLLHKGDSYVNIGHNGYMTNWNDTEDTGNHYKFYTVSAEAIDSLTSMVDQNVQNVALSELVKRANNDLLGLKYKNGFVDGGIYNAPADSGLVKAFVGNATSSQWNNPNNVEDKSQNAFDGDVNTFYHTATNKDAVLDNLNDGDNHWIQLDLGKEVKSLVIKFTRRNGAVNSHIAQYKLVAPTDTTVMNEDEGVWTEEVAKSEEAIKYQHDDFVAADSIDTLYQHPATHIATYELTKPSRYVRFVVTGTYCKKGNTIFATNADSTITTGPTWHVAEFRVYDAAETVANPKFENMDKAAKDALAAALAKAQGELEAGKATEATYKELEEALDAFWKAYPNPTDLLNTLETAQEMINNAIEGTELAQFQEGASDELQTVVDEINEKIDGKDLTLAEINAFQKQLDDAIDLFNSKLNVPETGKIYRIVCQMKRGMEDQAAGHKQWGAAVVSMNADPNDNPKWMNYDASTMNYYSGLWEIGGNMKTGFTFRNLGNGLYLNNPYEGLSKEEQDEQITDQLIRYSKEPKHFVLEASTVADAAFLVTFQKGQYLNFDPIGQVVHYYDRNDQHANFTFEEVEASLDEGMISVKPGKVQIITLPYAVDEVYGLGDFLPCEVVGLVDGKLQLNSIEGSIAAGVPFIMETAAEENSLGLVMPNTTEEEALSMEYVYEPVVKNGLVSAPYAFSTKTNYGVLVGKSVIEAEAGTAIEAGTGFFNNEINNLPAEAGEFELLVEGNIGGEGTAVEEVVIVKNVPMDVYTISGVKVRHNVKAANATKNLPKGVYIVGGKKVIVK